MKSHIESRNSRVLNNHFQVPPNPDYFQRFILLEEQEREKREFQKLIYGSVSPYSAPPQHSAPPPPVEDEEVSEEQESGDISEEKELEEVSEGTRKQKKVEFRKQTAIEVLTESQNSINIIYDTVPGDSEPLPSEEEILVEEESIEIPVDKESSNFIYDIAPQKSDSVVSEEGSTDSKEPHNSIYENTSGFSAELVAEELVTPEELQRFLDTSTTTSSGITWGNEFKLLFNNYKNNQTQINLDEGSFWRLESFTSSVFRCSNSFANQIRTRD